MERKEEIFVNWKFSFYLNFSSFPCIFLFFLKKNEKMKIKWKFTRENVSFLKFSSFHVFSFFHVFFIFGIREVKDGEEKGKLWKFAFSLGSFHFSSFPSIFSFFWRKMKIKWTFTRENASFIKFAFFLFFLLSLLRLERWKDGEERGNILEICICPSKCSFLSFWYNK